jgi:hypothetical protein
MSVMLMALRCSDSVKNEAKERKGKKETKSPDSLVRQDNPAYNNGFGSNSPVKCMYGVGGTTSLLHRSHAEHGPPKEQILTATKLRDAINRPLDDATR